MKKKLIAVAAACALLAAAGCNNENSQTTTTTAATEAESTTAADTAAESTEADNTTEAEVTEADTTETEESADVMTHAEYIAADLDTKVTVEAFIQAKQGWWENEGVGNASFYAQEKGEGGYFFYNMPCTQEEYDQLTAGTKVRVTGYKSEWSGEVEIIDSTFEIIDGETYIAEAEDITSLLGNNDELIEHQNEFVSFKGMTVEPKKDETGAEFNFMYKWNNSGERGDDLYFDVSKDGVTYTFTVESYLCGPETEVYQAVEALNAGDVIDLEGFLYWYDAPNPHITKVTKA